ncbi:unnamed protein product [Nezara viridula]|uniref:NFACT protein C-terminal domain-containing protein n=1 Tax=Nezara viridula TaxID=85310 RepID=A0A9P0ECQ6_NEZVI|nr:unnamed protein product [Nezara viridula]
MDKRSKPASNVKDMHGKLVTEEKEVLESAGTSKAAEKKNRKHQNKKNDKNYTLKVEKNQNTEGFPKPEKISIKPVVSQNPPYNEKLDDGDDTKDDEITVETNELDMLQSLTGVPHEDDEILFALPIVAPYTSILNNK